jgi:hypothetical protein
VVPLLEIDLLDAPQAHVGFGAVLFGLRTFTEKLACAASKSESISMLLDRCEAPSANYLKPGDSFAT